MVNNSQSARLLNISVIWKQMMLFWMLKSKQELVRPQQPSLNYFNEYGPINYSLKTKISTYKTSVLPILIQDCETWHCKKIHFKKLEGCQYRFLRTIIGKKWEDFISYLSIFEILETKKISITAIEPLVRMKRLQCLCKILKMDNSRLLRKVAFSETIEGKRKKGRPLLSWRQAISQDIKAFHLEHIYTLSECDQIKQLSQTPLHLEIADMEWKQTVTQKKLTKNTKSKLILI